MENKHLFDTLNADTQLTVFERILSYSVGDRSPECIERLVERYGSFSTVLSAREDELCTFGDMSRNAALLIKLVAYLNSRRKTDAFKLGVHHTELELREYIAALFLGSSVESVYALLLDDEGRVQSVQHISDGTVNSSDVVPRKILECARRARSTKIILAHNHPKGSVAPSKDDMMTTGRLFTLFASVGVRLMAHYIVADGEVGVIDSEMLYNPEYRG